MAGLFYKLGKLAGPKVRKAKWLLRSFTGTESEVIKAEFDAGRDLARAVTDQVPVDSDASVQRLVNELGGALADRLTNQRRQFTFCVLSAPEINAFALPGGFVFLNRPLLELCRMDRDELAFILGHEMGHVVRKHAFDRLMASSALHAAVRVVPVGGLIRSQLGGVVMDLLHKGYSQDQELDADLLGVRLARSAGFEAAAAVRLLDRLKSTSGESTPLDAYFSTHPPFDVRISHVNRFLKS